MACQPYAQLIEVKRWADRGLCEAIFAHLDRISDEDAALLRLVLDHILTVDRIFQHHLTGRPHGFSAARSEVLPDLETLAKGLRETGDWYGAYAAALTPAEAEAHVDFVFTSGKPARMRRGEILLHVCLHGTYHRGNAGALLQLRGLTPGRDAITDYLEDAA